MNSSQKPSSDRIEPSQTRMKPSEGRGEHYKTRTVGALAPPMLSEAEHGETSTVRPRLDTVYVKITMCELRAEEHSTVNETQTA